MNDADFALKGADLKAAIKVAQKMDMGFAFSPGKSPDTHFFAMDRKRTGPFLGKIAKKEGDDSKVSFGTCTIKDKAFVLTCDRFVPGLAKRLRRFLQSQKIIYMVVVLDKGGAFVEAEGDDEDGEAELYATAKPKSQDAPPAEDIKTLTAAFAERIRVAKPKIANAPEPVSGKLEALLAQVLEGVKGQEFDAAGKTMAQIETALKQIADKAEAPDQEPNTTAEDASEALARIKAVSDGLGALPAPAAQKLSAALKGAASKLKAGDADGAGIALDQIEAAMEKLSKAPAPASETPSTAVLPIWRAAKEATDVGLNNLQVALKSHGHPDMRAIADKGLNGMTDGNQTAMMSALMEFDGASGEARPKSGAALLQQVEAYRSFLSSNTYVDLFENNPLGVKVTIKAPLGAALDQIQTLARAAS